MIANNKILIRIDGMASDLTQGSVSSWLYRLTAPMVLGIMAIFLFNLVDTYFIGLLGTEPLAAVSFTFPVTMIIMNLAIGLSIATGAVVARALGQKEMEQAKTWITSSLYLATLVSVVLSIMCLMNQDRIFTWLGAPAHILPLIKSFMTWWLLGCGFLILMIVINASVRASGNTKLPSLLMLGSATLNGILDPLLIFGIGPFPELGIQGAAIATVISWVVAFALVLRYILKHQMVNLNWPAAITQKWKHLTKLAVPASLTNMLTPLASGILVAWIAPYGTHAVAGFGVGTRMEPLVMLVVMAFTSSLTPFVGQNHGAGEHDRIEKALRQCMQFVFVWQLLLYALLCLLAHPISTLFSEEAEVQSIIRMFIYIVPMSYFAVGFTLVSTATMNALHKTHVSLTLNLLRLFVFYLPCAWVGQYLGGLTGLFWGCAIGNLIMGMVVLALFLKVRQSECLKAKVFSV